MTASIQIAGHAIGPGHPCFIIAEAGVNHNGRVELAKKLVDAAVLSGADAVKFQTFRAEKVVSPVAPQAEYQAVNTGVVESQLDMVRKLELPFEAFGELAHHCRGQGIVFLSTPFDEESVDFLDSIGVPAFKIPSGEITNLEFVDHVARKQKPVILSTGMADLEEVRRAVHTIRASNPQVVVLHCVSNYPARASSINLRAMLTMARELEVAVGYSDHSMGIEIPMAAVALGATVLEKHFTLDRGLPGPDHVASLEPAELRAMVEGIRKVESALGDGRKAPAPEELATARVARCSLVAARDIEAGAVLTVEDIAVLRPGVGLPPSMRLQLVGQKALREIAAGTVFTLEMLG